MHLHNIYDLRVRTYPYYFGVGVLTIRLPHCVEHFLYAFCYTLYSFLRYEHINKVIPRTQYGIKWKNWVGRTHVVRGILLDFLLKKIKRL